jgi:hypothetical protein
VPLLLLLLTSATANGADKLFSSHEKLVVSLTGPFKTLYRERDVEKTYAGQLGYTDEHGGQVDLKVEVQVRGNYRLDRAHCSNPPLRVIIDKKVSKSSLFRKLKDVKLVVPCNKPSKYERYLILEYLIYRMYNQLTPQSYRVRLVEINLINSEREETRTYPAFFIEPHRRLRKRLDKKKVSVKSVTVNELEPEGLAMLSLFQYMIGNTDYSPLTGAAEKDCCHNVKLYQGKHDSQLTAIPYDFDFAGFVSAPYAEPHPKVNIRSVRMRRYRGYCEQNEDVRKSVAHFNSARDSIEDLIALSALHDGVKKSTTKYLKPFYEVINDPKKIEKLVLSYCR